jgi:hypothetical protein
MSWRRLCVTPRERWAVKAPPTSTRVELSCRDGIQRRALFQHSQMPSSGAKLRGTRRVTVLLSSRSSRFAVWAARNAKGRPSAWLHSCLRQCCFQSSQLFHVTVSSIIPSGAPNRSLKRTTTPSARQPLSSNVKRRYHAICFPRSSYGRGLHPDLSATAQPIICSSRSLKD